MTTPADSTIDALHISYETWISYTEEQKTKAVDDYLATIKDPKEFKKTLEEMKKDAEGVSQYIKQLKKDVQEKKRGTKDKTKRAEADRLIKELNDILKEFDYKKIAEDRVDNATKHNRDYSGGDDVNVGNTYDFDGSTFDVTLDNTPDPLGDDNEEGKHYEWDDAQGKMVLVPDAPQGNGGNNPYSGDPRLKPYLDKDGKLTDQDGDKIITKADLTMALLKANREKFNNSQKVFFDLPEGSKVEWIKPANQKEGDRTFRVTNSSGEIFFVTFHNVTANTAFAFKPGQLTKDEMNKYREDAKMANPEMAAQSYINGDYEPFLDKFNRNAEPDLTTLLPGYEEILADLKTDAAKNALKALYDVFNKEGFQSQDIIDALMKFSAEVTAELLIAVAKNAPDMFKKLGGYAITELEDKLWPKGGAEPSYNAKLAFALLELASGGAGRYGDKFFDKVFAHEKEAGKTTLVDGLWTDNAENVLVLEELKNISNKAGLGLTVSETAIENSRTRGGINEDGSKKPITKTPKQIYFSDALQTLYNSPRQEEGSWQMPEKDEFETFIQLIGDKLFDENGNVKSVTNSEFEQIANDATDWDYEIDDTINSFFYAIVTLPNDNPNLLALKKAILYKLGAQAAAYVNDNANDGGTAGKINDFLRDYPDPDKTGA